MHGPGPDISFGKYRILREVGRGGMGVVYLAEDTTLGRRVALKVLDHALTADPQFEARFRQEARLVASLEHPNIVPLHSLERVGEDLAIDMAYAERGSLGDAERGGAVRRSDVFHHISGVLQALTACHDAGIIHRDVKPSNILLAHDDRALLSDFGLSKLLSLQQGSAVQRTSSSSLFVGTPRYAPPESWEDREPTPAWDVYSVGMVLFEAVAGKLPYDATSPFALIKQMLERPVPPLADTAEGISQELSAAVSGLLNRDPSQRPQSARPALERLKATPEFGPVPGPAGSTVVRVKRRHHQASSRAVRGRGPALGRSAPGLVRVVLGAVVLLAMALTVGLALSHNGLGLSMSPREASDPTAGAAVYSEPFGVFDTVDAAAGERWMDHWIMVPAEERKDGQKSTGTCSVVASESTRLWCLSGASAPEEPDKLVFEGHWAEYGDRNARIFRYGTVSGTGYWFTPNRDMTVSLDFRTTQDGSRWSRSLLVTRAAGATTSSTCARRFEGSDFVQALLYNEVLPRGLAWAETVETVLVESSGGCRVVVPSLVGSGNGVKADGRLDEPTWLTDPLSGGAPLGRAGPTAGTDNAVMLLRCDEAALYIGLHVDRALGTPCLTMVVQPAVNIPVTDSPRWSIHAEGEQIVSSQFLDYGKSASWTCPWQVAVSNPEHAWEAEIVLPFAASGDGVRPIPGGRWRLNCTVTETHLTPSPTAEPAPPVARWGSENPERAEHGCLLVFGTTGPA